MGAPTTKIETVTIISPLKVLCLFFCVMSFLCLLICIPSTFWLESENLRFGLWYECSSINALICGFCAFILLTASLLSDYWLYSNDTKQGLWRLCNTHRTPKIIPYSLGTTGRMVPENVEYLCEYTFMIWIQICGALVVVSLICSFIGVVLICIGFSHKKDQDKRYKYYKGATFVYFIAVTFMATALILFPTMFMQEIRDRGKDVWYFGWAYGVAWGATIFLFGGSIVLICDRNREEVYIREKMYLNEDEEVGELNRA